MNYTQYLLELIEIICREAGLRPDEIALNEEDIQEHHKNGIPPKDLYHDVWDGDAGYFWKLPI